MAASNVIKQAAGSDVRSALAALNLDGAVALAAGDTIGMTVASTLKGVGVSVASAVLHTVPAGGQSNHDAVRDFCNAVTEAIDGVECYPSENSFDQFTLNFEGIAALADGVALTVPVVSVA